MASSATSGRLWDATVATSVASAAVKNCLSFCCLHCVFHIEVFALGIQRVAWQTLCWWWRTQVCDTHVSNLLSKNSMQSLLTSSIWDSLNILWSDRHLQSARKVSTFQQFQTGSKEMFDIATHWLKDAISGVLKRSAKAFSLNAIADVRRRRRIRRRHEIICWNISETVRASDLKIYHMVAHDSLYIFTGNDVINYFRSAGNCTNVSILGHVRVAISR